MVSDEWGFFTKAVHSGKGGKFMGEPLAIPIYQTSTFRFRSIDELVEAYKGREEAYTYTRVSNPTVRVAERRLAVLEIAEDGAAFSSGMSATSTALLSLVESGDHIVSSRDIYGGTRHFLADILQKLGIEVSFADATNTGQLEQVINGDTKVIFVESPTNPLLQIVDLSAIVEIAKRRGIKTVIDNTFATPYNQQPIKFGFDVVIHSGTKYLGGHDDLAAGIAVGSNQFVSRVTRLRSYLGGALDPHVGFMLVRGLMTLGLRVERQNSSAMKIAEFLERNERIKRVYYPGLRNHPQHELAKAQMRAFGGVLSFEVNGDLTAAKRFLNSLRLCSIAPSLGGVDTLVTSPAMTSHRHISREQRLQAGIADELIRLSVGVEDVSDIIRDLDTALKQI